MDSTNASGKTLNEICRTLKRRRAEDGFSYRTHDAGRNDLADPSTWSLPVYHCSTWYLVSCIVRYLHAFPNYQSVLSQFGVDPQSIFSEDGVA
jgi:hypothetical protein